MRFLSGLTTLVILFFLAFSPSYAETYYLDSQIGDDSFTGTSPQTPWKSLEILNEKRDDFQPGDQILFKRGLVWRGRLSLGAGGEDAPLVYSSYGEGEKPRLYGSISLSSPDQWTNGGENLWYADFSTIEVRDIGNIILDGDRAAWKRWRKESLKNEGDFWYDLMGKHRLWIYCDQNPAEMFSSIEAASMENIIDHSHAHWVVVEGLDLRYGAAHGFGGSGATHLTIRDCDVSWIGGGNQFLTDKDQNVRYGNGIEFWDTAEDCLIENCRLWEVYDAALTNQGFSVNKERNLVYRNNEIWRCEYSFEFWNHPKESITENILFENNVCRDAGFGWGHEQRPDPNGRHFMVYSNSSTTRNFVLRNNVFENATESLVRVDESKDNPAWPEEGLIMENNTLIQVEETPLFYWKGENLMSDPLHP